MSPQATDGRALNLPKRREEVIVAVRSAGQLRIDQRVDGWRCRASSPAARPSPAAGPPPASHAPPTSVNVAVDDDTGRPRPPSGCSSRRRSIRTGGCGDRRPSASREGTLRAAAADSEWPPAVAPWRPASPSLVVGPQMRRPDGHRDRERGEPPPRRCRPPHLPDPRSPAPAARRSRRASACRPRAGREHHPVRLDAHQLRRLQVEHDDHRAADDAPPARRPRRCRRPASAAPCRRPRAASAACSTSARARPPAPSRRAARPS